MTIMDDPLGRNKIVNTKNNEFNSALPSFQFGMNCRGFAAARLTWPAENLKIAV